MNTLPEGIFEFRHACLHLMLDKPAGLLYSEWVCQPDSEAYREAAVIIADFLKERDIDFWIQDTNRLGEVSAEDMKQVLQELLPVASAAGLKKLARITASDKDRVTFMELVSESKAKISSDTEVRQFSSYREAAEWIGSGSII